MSPAPEYTTALRAELERRRDELRTRYRAISDDLRRVRGPLDRQMDEQALELENAEVLEYLELRTRRELEDVLRALDRLAAGRYGICAACRADIEPQRLLALPFTSLCADCAERLEYA